MRQRNERGIVSLVGVMIACAIMLVLLAAMVPAMVRTAQTNNANSAALQLAQLNAAEFSFAQSYAMFPAPLALTGVLTQTLSCSNPMLLSGQQISNPSGYTISFTPKALKTSQTCTTVTGYAGYTVSVDPVSKLEGTRHFFSDTDDPAGTQLIHFAEGKPATDSDPVFATTGSSLIVVANGSGNTGNTGTCPTGSGETWNGSACVCPSGQTIVGGVCTAQKTCVTNESLLNGQCYTTFPSTQGYPLNYFYQTTATFNNSNNFPAPVIGTAALTFQFTGLNTLTISGQMSNWSTNVAAWNNSPPSFGTCIASGVIDLTAGGSITLSGCYVEGTWPVPAGDMSFSTNGLSYSFVNGVLNSSTLFEGQTPGLSMLISGSLNSMPN